jgi:TrwC relaxase
MTTSPGRSLLWMRPRKGHIGLASYYAERGETPGMWIGSGLAGIDGLTAGEPVTAEQMRALFGCGLHPLAELRQQQLEGPDLTQRDYQDAARLGAPFKIIDSEVGPFRLEVAKRIGAIPTAAGVAAGVPLPAADRARVRTEVAREFSEPSMAGSRLTAWNWLGKSQKTRGHGPRQLPGMT